MRPSILVRLLHWRHLRTTLQLGLLGVAVLIVVDGLRGPRVAPASLAASLTWVHYRGLLVIGLLAAGNVFCTACPMMLARNAGRRLLAPRFRWPRALRTKWIGLALFVAVLFAYELFDLWALPRATAWLLLGYFGAALLVDLTFKGATFCKYVCPIGQFSFAAAAVSPLEVKVNDAAVCHSCRTYDCIKGRAATVEQPAQRGCELGLFLPAKVGNLDCTLCLDCVHACPHHNVALTWRVPGAELSDASRRSGIGMLARRPDIAALAVVFTFGGLVNAFGMTGAGRAFQDSATRAMGVASEAASLTVLFVLGLCALPMVLLGGASAATLLVAGTGRTVAQVLVRHAHALIPLGFGIWLAHYLFHFLTGALLIVPGAGRAGLTAGQVLPIELGFLVLGAAGSLAVTLRIAERDYPASSWRAAAPWSAAILVVAIAAGWILLQPMEMRAAPFVG